MSILFKGYLDTEFFGSTVFEAATPSDVKACEQKLSNELQQYKEKIESLQKDIIRIFKIEDNIKADLKSGKWKELFIEGIKENQKEYEDTTNKLINEIRNQVDSISRNIDYHAQLKEDIDASKNDWENFFYQSFNEQFHNYFSNNIQETQNIKWEE